MHWRNTSTTGMRCMSEQMQQLIEQERQAQTLVENFCQNLVKKVEKADAFPGEVDNLSNNPCCAQVSISTVRKTKNLSLAPEYYFQPAQAKILKKELSGKVRATDVQKKLEALEKDAARLGLNETTVRILCEC